ncbi:MAG TPA: nuclear transport factor 2 family protein [Acidimicrobiales bacterium]|nr:nuclear transport factor 2 family protein [Acidimicrobiales bacterium]
MSQYTGPNDDDPAGVATAYFAAIKGHDADALRRLFAREAELVTGGLSVRGADAIADFYTTGAFTYDDLLPSPRPLEVDGDTVHVVIDLHMGGADHVVADTFRITDGKIQRLEIEFLTDDVLESMRKNQRGSDS